MSIIIGSMILVLIARVVIGKLVNQYPAIISLDIANGPRCQTCHNYFAYPYHDNQGQCTIEKIPCNGHEGSFWTLLECPRHGLLDNELFHRFRIYDDDERDRIRMKQFIPQKAV